MLVPAGKLCYKGKLTMMHAPGRRFFVSIDRINMGTPEQDRAAIDVLGITDAIPGLLAAIDAYRQDYAPAIQDSDGRPLAGVVPLDPYRVPYIDTPGLEEVELRRPDDTSLEEIVPIRGAVTGAIALIGTIHEYPPHPCDLTVHFARMDRLDEQEERSAPDDEVVELPQRTDLTLPAPAAYLRRRDGEMTVVQRRRRRH
jgi:hypothetical protein